MKTLAQERLSHRQRPPLSLEAAEALRLVKVVRCAALQAWELLDSNPLAEAVLAEIRRLAELADHHAAAEVAEARGDQP